MNSVLNSCYSRLGGARGAGNEKKNKIAASFVDSPVNIVTLAALVAILFFFSLVAFAHAEVAAPGWTVDSYAFPTNFSENAEAECFALGAGNNCTGGELRDSYQVTVTNAGSEPTDGSPMTVTDTLPTGPHGEQLLTEIGSTLTVWDQQGSTATQLGGCPVSAGVVRCTYAGVVHPDERFVLVIYVIVDKGASGPLLNRATVSGGGAPAVSAQASNPVSSTPAPFGVSSFDFYKAGLSGGPETQAGGHPYELATTIESNTEVKPGPFGPFETTDVENTKDIIVNLPLGFAGSTLAAPECTLAQLSTRKHCPPDTAIGYLVTEPITNTAIDSPLYNLVPERGYPAEFGYIDTLKGAHVLYVHVVPTSRGYVLQTESTDIPSVNLRRITAVFYGDPAEKQAEIRQRETETQLREKAEQVLREKGATPQEIAEKAEELQKNARVERERPAVQVPFFTNPTACSNGEQEASIYLDSWENPGTWRTPGHDPEVTTYTVNSTSTPILTGPESEGWVSGEKGISKSPAVSGCNSLKFTPELGAQPTTHEADKPTGLEFTTKLPQTETFGVNATPALKNLTISFPQGMTVDPSSADGLSTCSEAQIGYEGPTVFDFSEAKPECPEASKIGSLELETPLIPGKLYGEVYLAAQDQNPFGTTFAIYVVVNDPITGVVLKIAGELKANPQTGQLTSYFPENPQLPFSVLQVHFFGGPRAELATPSSCGIYQTTSVLEPWSAPDSGLPATPFDSYTIDENCATGFSPAFTGGATNLQGGAYTTFQASFERQDSDQELGGAEVNLPPGMLADVPSVTECGEAELAAEAADAPTGGCPASSKVGTVEAGAGPGPNPLFVPGNVFWTGPYKGGPFGLAVVVSANPGPFHFGNVIVRQSIRINPFTAAVTDVSDPFPTYLDPKNVNSRTGVQETTGIPIKLRRVDIEINRPGFTFNPTSCAKETFEVGGAITSVSGASKTLATPFQVTNCAHLKFAPSFSVSTSGKTSKANGASLTAKVLYGRAGISSPQGIYADIARVKVELPKALPSRLTTLQKACTAKQFEANPAGCPSASLIGHATVHTPILPGALSGPVYFVSHGGEAFPSLEVVLQGDGVTIDLVGATFISKAGITSTTFKTVPDSPFSSFEITLPEGKYSALAANGNLCTQKLTMPNEFIAQNGAAIHETTDISVGGCGKTLTRAQKLAAALKACHRDKNKGKKATCETAAKRKYGVVKKATKKKGK